MKRNLLFCELIILFAGIIATAGNEIGEVGSVDSGKKEIIVNVKSGINLKMGERLYVRAGDEIAVMDVTFPMMTSSKCQLLKEYIKLSGKIKKGMSVYFFDKTALKPGNTVSETTGVNLSGKSYFKNNNNGTMTDLRSGLTWLKDANCAGKALNWGDANSFCKTLKKGGYEDWRMPSKAELESLVSGLPEGTVWKTENWIPLLAGYGFDDVQAFYWTSTIHPVVLWPDNRYVMYIISGYKDEASLESDLRFIWPVRGKMISGKESNSSN